MKNLVFITIISAFIWSCSTSSKPNPEDQKPNIATQKKTDSADEWEVTVRCRVRNICRKQSTAEIDVHREQSQIPKHDSGQRMEFAILLPRQSQLL